MARDADAAPHGRVGQRHRRVRDAHRARAASRIIRPFPSAAGLLVAFQPVVSFMGGAINNDTAVNAAAAVAIYLVVRALRRGLSVRAGDRDRARARGAPAREGRRLWRRAGRRDRAADRDRARARAIKPLRLAAAAAGTIASGVARVDTAHRSVACQRAARLARQHRRRTTVAAHRCPRIPSSFIGYLIQTFVPPIQLKGNLTLGWPFYEIYIERAFGRFGWVTIGFPPFVYRVILVVAIGVAILAVVAAVRNRLARSRPLGSGARTWAGRARSGVVRRGRVHDFLRLDRSQSSRAATRSRPSSRSPRSPRSPASGSDEDAPRSSPERSSAP